MLLRHNEGGKNSPNNHNPNNLDNRGVPLRAPKASLTFLALAEAIAARRGTPAPKVTKVIAVTGPKDYRGPRGPRHPRDQGGSATNSDPDRHIEGIPTYGALSRSLMLEVKLGVLCRPPLALAAAVPHTRLLTRLPFTSVTAITSTWARRYPRLAGDLSTKRSAKTTTSSPRSKRGYRGYR